MGSAPGAAMFFSTYETMKKAQQDIDQLFMEKEIVSTSVFLTIFHHFGSVWLTGSVFLILFDPIHHTLGLLHLGPVTCR